MRVVMNLVYLRWVFTLRIQVLLQAGSAPYSAVLKQYQAKAEFFACACLRKNKGHDVKMTPGVLRTPRVKTPLFVNLDGLSRILVLIRVTILID